MTLADHLPNRSRFPIESFRRGRGATAIRHAARSTLAGAKQVARAVLVLAIFAVMLAAAMALGLLIWVPHFHVNW